MVSQDLSIIAPKILTNQFKPYLRQKCEVAGLFPNQPKHFSNDNWYFPNPASENWDRQHPTRLLVSKGTSINYVEMILRIIVPPPLSMTNLLHKIMIYEL